MGGRVTGRDVGQGDVVGVDLSELPHAPRDPGRGGGAGDDQHHDQAQEQPFGQAQQRAQFANQAQQQNFQNQSYAQQLPINEFTALMSTGQVTPPAPAQLSSTAVSPTDVLGPAAAFSLAFAMNS